MAAKTDRTCEKFFVEPLLPPPVQFSDTPCIETISRVIKIYLTELRNIKRPPGPDLPFLAGRGPSNVFNFATEKSPYLRMTTMRRNITGHVIRLCMVWHLRQSPSKPQLYRGIVQMRPIHWLAGLLQRIG